jgi:PKD domain
MYGPVAEGTLRLEFDGKELPQTTPTPTPSPTATPTPTPTATPTPTPLCCTDVGLKAEEELIAGSGQYGLVGMCVPVARNVRLTATANPAGIPGLQYNFDFGDGTSTGYSASNTAIHAYTLAGDFSATVLVWQSGTSCPPKGHSLPLQVDCCPTAGQQPDQYWDPKLKQCVNCPQGLTIPKPSKPTGCAPGSVGPVSLNAIPPPGLPGVASSTRGTQPGTL